MNISKNTKLLVVVLLSLLMAACEQKGPAGPVDNVALIKGVYDAFAKGDLPAVLGAMDTEIIWNEAENFPYADGNPYTGRDAVVEGVFSRLVGEWDYWTLENGNFYNAGDVVIATGYYNARNKATGIVIHAQFAHIWRLRDRVIVSFQQYADTAQVSRAVAGE